MSGYPLDTLLNIRKQSKKNAEHSFGAKLAIQQCAQHKLNNLKNKLSQKRDIRKNLSRDLFEKNRAKKSYEFQEINSVGLRIQKILTDINFVQQEISQQQQLVDKTTRAKNNAQASLTQAHQKLKILEKHFNSWQQQQKKSQQLRAEYNNDDLSCAQFWRTSRVKI